MGSFRAGFNLHKKLDLVAKSIIDRRSNQLIPVKRDEGGSDAIAK